MTSKKEVNQLTSAYEHCLCVAKSHYENFPVASFLLPKRIKLAIAAIYAFARTADNYADSTNLSATEKLHALEDLQIDLTSQNSTKPIMLALHNTINSFNLPVNLFLDLISAFKQDVVKSRYENFAEILDYCSKSANPIGRILLYINNQVNKENLEYSDHICTSLQLIDFMQDLSFDLNVLDRCYLPANELQQFNVEIKDLKQQSQTKNISDLIKYQLSRIHVILTKGMPLGERLHGRFGLEVKAILAGSSQILEALEKRTDHYYRPTLNWSQKLYIFWHVLTKRENMEL